MSHDEGSDESYETSVPVIGAAAAAAATFSARVGRGHHSDFIAPPRPGATILVMFVMASAVRSVAGRQRQARRVRGEEALSRESIGRGASVFAWNYRDRVEFRFRRTRLVRQPRFLQTEQLTQRPSHGHRCHRILAGRTCIRKDATTLFLRRGRSNREKGRGPLAQAAQERDRIFAALPHFHERRRDDDTVDVRGQALYLLAAADAEARAHGQR